MSKRKPIAYYGKPVGPEKSKRTVEDRAAKERTEPLVPESVLTVRNTQLLSRGQLADLMRLVNRVLEENSGREFPLVRMQRLRNTLNYSLSQKRVTNRIAKQIQSAFKHFSPAVEKHNPNDHTFERIIVKFHAPQAS